MYDVAQSGSALMPRGLQGVRNTVPRKWTLQQTTENNTGRMQKIALVCSTQSCSLFVSPTRVLQNTSNVAELATATAFL